jgi:hypothetical protein
VAERVQQLGTAIPRRDDDRHVGHGITATLRRTRVWQAPVRGVRM